MNTLALSGLMRAAGPVLERRPSGSCYIPRTKYIVVYPPLDVHASLKSCFLERVMGMPLALEALK